MAVKYVEIIGPNAMAPSDMKYVEKILRSAKIPVKNTGRETSDYSTKSLKVPAMREAAAEKIYDSLKWNTMKDKSMAKKVAKALPRNPKGYFGASIYSDDWW